MSGYEPRFDLDYNKRGLPGERYAAAIRDAIYRDRVEVKTDYLMLKTGNVYVEYEQRDRHGKWIPSGIAVDETAEIWMFCSPSQQGALVIASSTLKEVSRDVLRESGRVERDSPCKAEPDRIEQPHRYRAVGCCPTSSAETRPTHGVKVPVKRLMESAWTVGLEAEAA